MNHPIAHEGNPRQTPDLTITGGSVLSTASLAIEFLGPVTELIPPPVPEIRISASNTNKYQFSNFQWGIDCADNDGQTQASISAAVDTVPFQPSSGSFLEYSRLSGLVMYGCVLSPFVGTNVHAYDAAASTTTPTFHDFHNEDFFAYTQKDWTNYRKPNSPFASINFINLFASATILAVDGFPISGVAVGVPSTATVDNFTGIVSAYDWGTSTEYLLRYTNASLRTFGEILSSTSRFPPSTDELITMQMTYVTATGLFNLTTPNITLNGLTSTDIPFLNNDMRAAVVDLGRSTDSGQDDDVVWQKVQAEVYYI